MVKPPTADDLELMQGYPAPVDRRVTRSNLMLPPNNRWAFQHMREFMPTAGIYRGDGPVRVLNQRPVELANFSFASTNGSEHTVDEMLDASYADALVVLHDGELVFERYLNGMNPASQHQMMSVTKSLCGTLALQLIHEGLIDEDLPVGHYLPELAGSAWEDANVKHAMDMSTGIAFSEVYDWEDELGDMVRYAICSGLSDSPDGYQGPTTITELFPTFQKDGEHGHMFHYVTPNTDIVGWIIGRVTGVPLSQAFSERIWSQLGTERDAYIIRDHIGMDMAGGGLNATARDLARFGQMILDNGQVDGRQVIAPEVVAEIFKGGDQEAFARGSEEWSPLWKGWSYRAFWWITHNANNAFTGIGINGQWLYIDPTARVVIVQQSSFPTADQPAIDEIVLPGFNAIARHLSNQG